MWSAVDGQLGVSFHHLRASYCQDALRSEISIKSFMINRQDAGVSVSSDEKCVTGLNVSQKLIHRLLWIIRHIEKKQEKKRKKKHTDTLLLCDASGDAVFSSKMRE